VERTNKRGLVGNIYKGRVARVLPGMQAAFVDIGLDRAAFLHASDIRLTPGEDNCTTRQVTEERQISTLCTEGQELLVQVVKDPLGTKGARLTTQISLPSRYLVLLPGIDCVGVSQRIENETERLRLRDIVHNYPNFNANGVIIRTAAEGVSAAALISDLEFLLRLSKSIQDRIASAPLKSILYEDLPLAMRCLRDLVGATVEKILVDEQESYEKIVHFAEQLVPYLVGHIELHTREIPLFDFYGIDSEINKALERKVPLKSGGYLIIDQTEAMTTIDVNTGAFVGRHNLEETIFKTNIEAATAIVRQLRIRNLGGIIIIDFIDMLEDEHKRQLLRALEKALERDHAKSYVSSVSSLGLVEMTRQRTRESLSHILCEPCPMCRGRGFVKSVETVAYEILREILREARQFNSAEQFLILAVQEVIDLLRNDESASLAEITALIGKPIQLQPELFSSQEQFDVVLM